MAGCRASPSVESCQKPDDGRRSFTKVTSASYTLNNTSTRCLMNGRWIHHPFNQEGYHYYLAEEDPNLPASLRCDFDTNNNYVDKPIPSHFYRVVHSDTVELSAHDRDSDRPISAPQLKLSERSTSVTGYKGYSMIRATHGVDSGSWFYEITIRDQPDGSHCRVGWSQPFGCLQAPAGYDQFSYAYRSRKGTRFHESIGKHYGEGYGAGDTIGVLIDLPTTSTLRNVRSSAHLIWHKPNHFFEEKDRRQDAIKDLTPLPGSKMEFFKNGESQGVAFVDVNKGTYFPALSLFGNITLSANFGPDFSFPPVERSYRAIIDMYVVSGALITNPSSVSDCTYTSAAVFDYPFFALHWAMLDLRAKLLSERAEEQQVEDCLSDMLFLAEHSPEPDTLRRDVAALDEFVKKPKNKRRPSGHRKRRC